MRLMMKYKRLICPAVSLGEPAPHVQYAWMRHHAVDAACVTNSVVLASAG